MDYRENIAATLAARSNCGMPRPTAEEMSRFHFSPHTTLESAVEALCEQFMENDDHFEMFLDEARGWVGRQKPEWVEELMRGVV